MVMVIKKKEKTGRAGFAVLFSSLSLCLCLSVCVFSAEEALLFLRSSKFRIQKERKTK